LRLGRMHSSFENNQIIVQTEGRPRKLTPQPRGNPVPVTKVAACD
jgi:hypothetical protein